MATPQQKRGIPRGARPPASTQSGAVPVVAPGPVIPEVPGSPGVVDHSQMVREPNEADLRKTATRGPKGHYEGVIRAYLAAGKPVMYLEKEPFKAAVLRDRRTPDADLQDRSIQQGFRNNLIRMELWDRHRVSLFADGEIALHERGAKPR